MSFPQRSERLGMKWLKVAVERRELGTDRYRIFGLIEAAGCTPDDYPACQAIGQHQIWESDATIVN